MKTENASKLREIFVVILDLPEGADPTNIRQLSHPKWDSLATVSIMAAIESEFGLTLDSTDMDRIRSFEATELLLDERGL